MAPFLPRRRVLSGLAVLALAPLTAGLTLPDGAHAADTPSRIVSIGGGVTEIVYALGEQDRIVAIDTTSIYPEPTTELPNVGYMRQLAAEGVLALNPDLILAIEGSGPPPAVQVLKASSFPMIEVPEAHTAASVLEKVAGRRQGAGRPGKGTGAEGSDHRRLRGNARSCRWREGPSARSVPAVGR